VSLFTQTRSDVRNKAGDDVIIVVENHGEGHLAGFGCLLIFFAFVTEGFAKIARELYVQDAYAVNFKINVLSLPFRFVQRLKKGAVYTWITI